MSGRHLLAIAYGLWCLVVVALYGRALVEGTVPFASGGRAAATARAPYGPHHK